jgi:hypothetical protein
MLSSRGFNFMFFRPKREELLINVCILATSRSLVAPRSDWSSPVYPPRIPETPKSWSAARDCRNCVIADESLPLVGMPPLSLLPVSLEGGVWRALASLESVRSRRVRLAMPKSLRA